MKQIGRNIVIDKIKGLTIILVVLGHVIQNVYNPVNYDQVFLFKVIYSFHMPLFIFISGYLAGDKDDLDVKWIEKRFIRLVIPFFVWIPLKFFFNGGKSFEKLMLVIIRIIQDPSDGGLWFLWILFLCSCILFITCNSSKVIYKFVSPLILLNEMTFFILNQIIVLIILALLWALTGFTTWFGFRLCCKEIIYFLLGYNLKKCNKTNYRVFMFCFVLFPILVLFWDRTHLVTFYSILDKYMLDSVILKMLITITLIGYYILVSCLGIGFIWGIESKINIPYIDRGLVYLGQYTIEIYILHTFFIFPMPINIISNSIICCVLGIIFPVLIGMIVRKSKLLSKILFGK